MNAFASMTAAGVRAGVRLRHPGDAVRPVGGRAGGRVAPHDPTSGSASGPRSTPTPAAAGGPPAATRAACSRPARPRASRSGTCRATWTAGRPAGSAVRRAELPRLRDARWSRARSRSSAKERCMASSTDDRSWTSTRSPSARRGAWPGRPGRPIVDAGQEAHHGLGRAGHAAAGRAAGRRPRRHPVGQPAARRRTRRRRARARHRAARCGTPWRAARPTTSRCSPRRPSAGSVRFRLPEGRELHAGARGRAQAGRRRHQDGSTPAGVSASGW